MVSQKFLAYALPLGIALFACTSSASAQQAIYPDRPIHLVVPFPPGGSADVLGRLFGQQLSSRLAQSVIIENKPGAGTAIGAKTVARSAPDGYTLLLGTVSSHAMNPAITDVGYDPVKDFTPVASLVSIPFVVLVNSGVPAKNMKDLIALARQAPGKLAYSSAGNGTSNHLAGALLENMAHIEMLHIPYKGSAPAMNDLLAGQVSVMFDLQLTAMPQMETGRVRALAITSSRRSTLLPDLPTVEESGTPGYEASAWFGIFGPANLPATVVSKLNAEFNKILNDPQVKTQLVKLGSEATPDTPEAFAAYVRSEATKWGSVVDSAKLVSK